MALIGIIIAANNGDNLPVKAKANPTAWDAASMVNEVKVRHATVLPSSVLNAWSTFWVDLAKAFVELKLDAGNLQGHITAFEDVAETLK